MSEVLSMNDQNAAYSASPDAHGLGSTVSEGGAGRASPGDLLRHAREQSGLHIVALAAALKVPVRKLEALEANRWQDLQDATFVRALASSVCRQLKIDAAPVLSGLPAGVQVKLDLPQGLGRAHLPQPAGIASGSSEGLGSILRWWPVAVLLVGAVALYLVPGIPKLAFPGNSAQMQPDSAASQVPVMPPVESPVAANTPAQGDTGQVAPATPAVVPVTALPNDVERPVAPQQAPALDSAVGGSVANAQASAVATSASKAEGGNILIIRATAETWIEVVDAAGRLRVQRVLQPGEAVDFAGSTPYAVTLGRADSAQVTVRGQPFDAVAVARNNVARFEVK